MPAIRSHQRPPETFADLNAVLALRPINDRADFDNAAEMIDRLLAVSDRTRDQDDYLETLSTLVEKYEAENQPIDTRRATVLDTIQYLVESHGMSASDLGRLLGDRALGSRVLSGERTPSKAHVTILARHFKVNPALFLDDTASS